MASSPDIPRSRIPAATLWRLGLAAAAGLWIGRRIPLPVAMAASGAALALLPKRRQQPFPVPETAAEDEAGDGLWPKAPVTQPFVPHTRAWDELREALSPVLHAPTAENTKAPELSACDGIVIEGLAFEATQPFILDDEDPVSENR